MDPNPPTPADADPATPPVPQRSASGAVLEATARGLGHAGTALARPRVRTVTVGIVLILLGAVILHSGVWTLPLVVVGIVMVIVAWVGSRMEGRISLEWGDSGAGFEMSAHFKAPPAAALASGAGPARSSSPSSTAPPITPVLVNRAEADVEEVIEGEAHTIELGLDDLHALIAAAEQAIADREPSTSTDTVPVTWVSNGDGHSANGSGTA